MGDLVRLALLLLVIVEPVGAMAVFGSMAAPARAGLVAVAGALSILGAAALLAGPVLRALDLSPEGAEAAAGLVLLVPAVRLLALGDQRNLLSARSAAGRWHGILVPLVVPLLAGPAAVAASIAYSSRRGTGLTLGALVVALVVVGALLAMVAHHAQRRSPRALSIAGRFMGAAMAVVAFDLMVDGVLAV